MSVMDVKDTEWVEHCLFDYERRRCISRVLSVHSENAVDKGNNYASDLYRLKLKVVLHSGEVENRSAIYKCLPDSPHRKIAMKMSGFFSKEAKMYQDLLPTIEEIRRARVDDEGPVSAECYAVKKRGEGFLFEDLSVKGFRCANRRKGLNTQQANFAIKALAKYHALTAIAIERGDVVKQDYGQHPFVLSPEHSLNAFSNNYVELAKVIEEKWPPEMAEYAERLRTFKNTISKKVLEDFETDRTKFTIINHGDCWLNNMLFKFDENGTPTDIRFVDFQMAHCGRPGLDLNYMFQTSLEYEIMDRTPEFLNTYYKSLISNLQFFGYSSPLPTFEDIEEGYFKASRFALAMALAFRSLMMCATKDDAPDMEEVCKQMEETKSFTMTRYDYDDQVFINTIKCLLRDGKSKGIL